MKNQGLAKKISLILKPKENKSFRAELKEKEDIYQIMQAAYNKYWLVNDRLEKNYQTDPSQKALNAEFKIFEIIDEKIEDDVNLIHENLISEKESLLNKAYADYIKILKKSNTRLRIEIKDLNTDIHLKINGKNKITDEIKNIRNTIDQRIEEKKVLIDIIDQEIVKKSKLIIATVISSAHYLLDPETFDAVIMDEASQVASFMSLIPLMKAKKFILVGDDKQLQPIEESNLSKELNLSIFNRLIDKYPENCTFLDTQYRMNKKIADISSNLFYDGKLKTYEEIADQTLECQLDEETAIIINPGTALTFIDTKDVDYYEVGVGDGCENVDEAKIVLQLVNGLLGNDVDPVEIGIITPYKKHKRVLNKLLQNTEVEIDTVHAFQGREKDIIIMSFCKSVIGRLNYFKKRFMEKPTQLNVAMTRARKKLIIIGNSKTLKQSKKIKEIINCIDEDNIIAYRD